MDKNRRLLIIFVVLFVGMLVPMYFLKNPSVVVSSALKKLETDSAFMGVATIGTFAPASTAMAMGAPAGEAVPIVFVGEGGFNMPPDQPPSGRATLVMEGGDPAKPLTLDLAALQDGSAF